MLQPISDMGYTFVGLVAGGGPVHEPRRFSTPVTKAKVLLSPSLWATLLCSKQQGGRVVGVCCEENGTWRPLGWKSIFAFLGGYASNNHRWMARGLVVVSNVISVRSPYHPWGACYQCSCSRKCL
jgi:hypothetical protein